jgi:hypothetical protein
MNANDKRHRAILVNITQRALLERDLLPDFSAEAHAECEMSVLTYTPGMVKHVTFVGDRTEL